MTTFERAIVFVHWHLSLFVRTPPEPGQCSKCWRDAADCTLHEGTEVR